MDIIKGDLSFYQLNKISGSYIAELQSGGAYFPCCYELHIYFGLNAADIILARFDNKSRALKAQDYLGRILAYGAYEQIVDIRNPED